MTYIKRIVLLIFAALFTFNLSFAKNSHNNAIGRNLSIFNSLVKELDMNYVDSIKVDETFKVAIAAMLNTIDPYTEYLSPEDQKGFETMTSGEYGGIGSYIMERNGAVYISGPYENSPADKVGLKSGDKILEIDTTNMIGKKSSEVSAMLKGPAGSKVKVKIYRPYSHDSIQTFELERQKLRLPSVPYYGVINNNTGYIKLNSFMEKSGEEVREALLSFKSNPNVKYVILDLRGNGGGLLESAVEIVNFFVPKGVEVLRTKGKEKSSEKIYKTAKKPIMADIPLAILIDGNSASSSEIVAGALQDLDRAVLIGSRSYGKGLVQSTRQLPYDGLLKVTVSKYYIPSGRLIQAYDFSHRNSDGSVARTPDSLTNEFKTKHGRIVRDGGGLKPDIEIEWKKINGLIYNLVTDNWIFDYATKYASQNPSIPTPEDFVITDEIYTDFKQSIDPKKLKYDKLCEEIVKQLRETAKSEGYLNDESQQKLDEIEKLLTHNLDKDLDTHRAHISEYLASEIVGRYYYDRGIVRQSLKSDDAVNKAIEVLSSPEKLKEILNH